MIRAYLTWLCEQVGYWIRPYDMLLDARRWRWQPRGQCGFGMTVTFPPLPQGATGWRVYDGSGRYYDTETGRWHDGNSASTRYVQGELADG